MRQFIKYACVLMLACVLILEITGCSESKTRPQQSTLDSPEHHTLRGKDRIRENRWDEARREFELALELAPEHSPALAGMALVTAYDSQLPGKPAEQKKSGVKKATDLLDDAFSYAKDDQQKANAHTVGIQVWTYLQTDNWLSKAENHFEKAIDIFDDTPELQSLRAEPHFYIANAYRQALQLQKSVDQYRKVLALNLSFTRAANEALELLDKIIRAQPGSRHGKQVALIPAITRGDMAALLIEELHLNELYRRNAEPNNNAFESPVKTFVPPGEQPSPDVLATDISTHPLRSDIEDVLKLKIRGLEADPQYLFYPNKTITRAEFAVMIEDILIQVTQDRNLSTRFIGESSPWKDVREDVFYYNAARTLVSRSIMSVWNRGRAEFGPNEIVSGADALLSLRIFKDELQNYVRSPEN